MVGHWTVFLQYLYPVEYLFQNDRSWHFLVQDLVSERKIAILLLRDAVHA